MATVDMVPDRAWLLKSVAFVFVFVFVFAVHASLAAGLIEGGGEQAAHKWSLASNTPTVGPGPSEHCTRLVPGPARRGEARAASLDDLLYLRDFGAAGLDMNAAPGFAVSPDGTRLAVQVRQADPDSNTYCQALMIFELHKPAAAPAVIALGNELARTSSDMYGLRAFPAGVARPLTPLWSPDGRWLAFVQRRNGRDSLFIVQASGGAAVPVAEPDASVGEFSWSADGAFLNFESDAPLQRARSRLESEGRNGYRYDNRFWIVAETTPYVRGNVETSRFRLAIGRTGPQGEARPVPTDPSPDGDRAWVEPLAKPAFAMRTRLRARVGEKEFTCGFATCELAGAAWWARSAGTVVYLRREAFASSLTAVYAWKPGGGAPQRVAITQDALTGCTLAVTQLVCGRERSASPRDIVAIDIRSGRLKEILDLNPEWKEITRPRIIRLRWTNRYGIPAIGDLVLPQSRPAGEKVPLVVVQYETRGFLRGGTGDEYPIRAMAAAGLAVLSISRPLDYNIWLARAGRSFSQRELVNNWTDRASVQDSLQRGIVLAARLVPLDRQHLAITGLSDGSSTAAYALIHSRLFSLALLSTCCEDPALLTTSVGPAFEDLQRTYEYPLPWQAHQDSWRQISLAMNARQVCAEIQIQAADREARMALASLVALRETGIPIELYLFPDEYHIKWQPAHRAAVYRRNITKLLEWRSRPPVSCHR